MSGDHHQHDHDGHDSAARPAHGHDAQSHTHPAHDHSGHDHSTHDHSAHDHASHAHHGHGHHGHSHAPASFGLAFAVGATLNSLFVVGEAVFGVLGHSLALLADAGHNLGDVLALLVAWGATRLVKAQPSARYTYGLRSTSMLAALFNAVVLLLITGAVAAEALRRLFHPEGVQGTTVMMVAAVGILVNGGTALMFVSGRNSDINIRGAFQHMLADALVAAGVVAAGGAILLTGWTRIDPLASLIVSAIIVWGTWGLLKDSINMVLHAVPPGIEPDAVRGYLEQRQGVEELHDLHIWPMSTTETALTAHLVMPAGHPGDAALGQICKDLRDRFGIGHATIQIEVSTEADCALQPAHVV
jgi:cobalt-zinc-cadmium efflux system protein